MAIEHHSILFLRLVSLSYLRTAKGIVLKRETAAGKASARAFVFLEGTRLLPVCLTALKNNYSNMKHTSLGIGVNDARSSEQMFP